MRFRLALLGTATSLALAAAVVTAAPAEARRSIGGFDSHCVYPGEAEVTLHGQGLGANCICVVLLTDFSDVLLGPNGKCPPGNDPTVRK